MNTIIVDVRTPKEFAEGHNPERLLSQPVHSIYSNLSILKMDIFPWYALAGIVQDFSNHR
jgi:rhodanese-related sulfurtransferase